MSLILILLHIEFLAIKRWFATELASKLLVLIGFMIVTLGLIKIIYSFCNTFFVSLSSYESFGRLTADYLIHASILMLVWFAVGSSIASYFTFLVSPKREFTYLLSLPIDPMVMTRYHFMKTQVINSMLLTLILSPVAVAYGNSFLRSSWPTFLANFIFVIILITLLANGLALFLSTWIAEKRKLINWQVVSAGIILFLGAGYILLRLIFPPTLIDLNNASLENYLPIYKNLPLNKPYLPTQWLTHTLTQGLTLESVYALLMTTIVLTTSLIFHQRRFLKLIQTQGETKAKNTHTLRNIDFTHWPLIKKDWLALSRSPSELGSALFLLSMALTFFLLLSSIQIFRVVELRFQTQLILFTFAWLFFFTTAYLLRIVFPLMAKEGTNPWYIFCQPLELISLLKSKVILALLLTSPFLLIALIIWRFLPFTVNQYQIVTLTSIWGIVVLTLGQGFLGAIVPNFSQSKDPEKVSTGIMGIMTLIFSISLTFMLVKNLNEIVKTPDAASILSLISFVATSVVLFGLYLLARNSLSRYEF